MEIFIETGNIMVTTKKRKQLQKMMPRVRWVVLLVMTMATSLLLANKLSKFVTRNHPAFQAPPPLGPFFMLTHDLVTASLNLVQRWCPPLTAFMTP